MVYMEDVLPFFNTLINGNELLSGLSMIGDAVLYGDLGTLAQKKRLESNALWESMTSGSNPEQSFERGRGRREEMRIWSSL